MARKKANKLYESKRVKFYEFGHKYLLDGKDELIGVTTLMKKHGLSPDYSGIDPDVLAHAAELGSQAHRRIEAYINGTPVPETRLIKTYRDLGLNVVRTEYLVTDESAVASSIDLLAQTGEGVYDIIDMKRTSSVHRDALAWQLGIYKYLFLLNNPWAKVGKCWCLPIKKGNKDDIEADECGLLVEIQPVPEAEVKRLLEAEANGETYQPAEDGGKMPVPYSDVAVAVSTFRKLEEIKNTVKALEATYKEICDRLAFDDVVIKLKRPYATTKFDTAKFKAEHPDLYDGYTYNSVVKGNVTIKLK